MTVVHVVALVLAVLALWIVGGVIVHDVRGIGRRREADALVRRVAAWEAAKRAAITSEPVELAAELVTWQQVADLLDRNVVDAIEGRPELETPAATDGGPGWPVRNYRAGETAYLDEE